MTRYYTSTPLLLGLLATLAATIIDNANAQITIGIPGLIEVNVTIPEEVNDIVDALTGDRDKPDDDFVSTFANVSLSVDFEALFQELHDFIGESLANFSLPPEIEEIFELPEFAGVEFTFGGNCTICDASHDANTNVTLDGRIDGVSCQDWDIVATLGIVDGTTQCDLLRVAAAEYCGCPVPDVNAGRTCPICPIAGEEPEDNYPLEDTIGVYCMDLLDPPAVDGDQTCNTVENVAAQCACSVITSFEETTPQDGVVGLMSGAASTTATTSSIVALLALGSLSMLWL